MTGNLSIDFADDRTLVVRPAGRLDGELARALLRVVATAVADEVPRTNVELDGVRSCGAEGAAAVTGCRRLAELRPGRVVVTGGAL